MTSVSRRDLDTSIPSVLPESPDGAKASSEVKGGTQGNQLETYRGPPSQAEQARSGAPSVGGEGGLTAGQLALLGAASRPVAIYDDIKACLTTDWKDWAITDADVRRIHTQLETLSPADYRKMMGRLERDGLLAKYLEEANPEARKGFLAQAERKGYVATRPQEKVETAPAMPPDGPVFFRPDAELPESVRELIHTENRTAARGYCAAYKEYLQRYEQKVSQSQSLIDLRVLGQPQEPLSLDFQMAAHHPDYEEARAKWRANVRLPNTKKAYVLIENRKRDLTGQMHAGSFRLKHEAEAKVDIGSTSLKLAREDSLSQSGQVETTTKTGAEASGQGIKVGVELDSSGATKQKVGAETPLFSIEQDSEGATKMELRAGPLAKVYSEFNPEKGKFGGGVSIEKDLSQRNGVKSELGFEWQGARRGRAGEALHGSGIFEDFTELEQGIPWERLAPARRELIKVRGWTAEAWAQALQRPAHERR